MVQNPNWPLFDEAVSFTTGPNTAPSTLSLWASMIGRTEGAWTSLRGRQYELDQTQAGTANSTLRNTDGAFDPNNASSPFYPQVTPFRAYRRRAQLPATINLLTPTQATAGAVADTPTGTPVATPGLPAHVTAGVFGLTTAVISGTQVYQSGSIPHTATVPSAIMTVSGWSVTAGQQYSASVVTNAGSAAVIIAQFNWYGPTGTLLSVTSGSPSGSGTPTVTGTAPSGAAGATVSLVLTTPPTSASAVTAVDWQVNTGTVAAYVQPGYWYSLFTGFVSRWPQTWVDGGTYGTAQVQAVDVFGYLSQRKILSPAYMEMLALGPNFLYPLDEDQGASLFYDLTATRQPLPIQAIPNTATVLAQCAAGSELANTVGQLPQGIGGPVVTFDNPPTGSTGAALNMAAAANASSLTPGPPPTGAWTRVIAFKPQPLPPLGDTSYLWFAVDSSFQNGIEIQVNGDGSLTVSAERAGTPTISQTIAATGEIATGQWHIFALACTADGKTVTSFLDATNPVVATYGSDVRPIFTSTSVETFGSYVTAAGGPLNGYVGDMSMVAEFPFVLTTAQWDLIYTAFQYGGKVDPALGGAGATSASRYQDILRWATWNGPQSEDNYTTGETVAYGPSVDLLASASSLGTDGVSALQTVVDTDNGSHIVTDSGTIEFRARRHRYNVTVPKVTFGENTAGGEIPYTTVSFGLDTTRLANDASATATGNANITQRAINGTSISNYGDVSLQRNVNTLNPYELSDAAQFLANHYATPLQRLETISVSPSTFTISGAPSTNAWAALLSLHFGDLVTVNRRPPGATVISFTGFVEQIQWKIDDQLGAVCQLQISPNVGLQFWEVAATTVTLKNSVTVGSGSCVINPLPDSATNAFTSSWPTGDAVEIGTYNAVIDWGTAVAEYITVNPNAAAIGYTSATLNVGNCLAVAGGSITTGFGFNHSAAAVIQYIGDAVSIPPYSTGTSLGSVLSPSNVLDQFCQLGSTTIVGY